jgi:hypothetical protein
MSSKSLSLPTVPFGSKERIFGGQFSSKSIDTMAKIDVLELLRIVEVLNGDARCLAAQQG